MKIKKVLSLLLATVMATSCFSGAFAESATTSVTASIPAATFSVTVPLKLPCAFNEDGTMIAPTTEAKITNNSVRAIKVADVEFNTSNDWSEYINENDDFFNKQPINTKKLVMKIDDSYIIRGDNSIFANNLGTIEAGENKVLNYNVWIVPQSTALENVELCTLTFTFDWAD